MAQISEYQLTGDIQLGLQNLIVLTVLGLLFTLLVTSESWKMAATDTLEDL
jgi:hypothetical protein